MKKTVIYVTASIFVAILFSACGTKTQVKQPIQQSVQQVDKAVKHPISAEYLVNICKEFGYKLDDIKNQPGINLNEMFNTEVSDYYMLNSADNPNVSILYIKTNDASGASKVFEDWKADRTNTYKECGKPILTSDKGITKFLMENNNEYIILLKEDNVVISINAMDKEIYKVKSLLKKLQY